MLPYPSKTFYILLLIFFAVFVIVSFINFGYAYAIPTEDTNKPENISTAAVKFLYVVNILMGLIFVFVTIYLIYLLVAKYDKSMLEYMTKFDAIEDRIDKKKIDTLQGTNNYLVKAFNNVVARLKAKDDAEDPMASPDPIIRLTPDSGKIQKLVVKAGIGADGKPIFKYLNLPTTKDGEVVGVLVKPEAAPNNNGWKNVSFDIETQKCYNLQSSDSKKPVVGLVAPEDPRIRGGMGLPLENWRDRDMSNEFIPISATGGQSCNTGACNSMVPLHPEYMTNSCGPLKPVGPCGTIYSTPLNIGRVNYK